jgi:hypothetical protein
MLSEELISYIKQNQAAGFSRPDIESALKNAGWDAIDIAAAFASLGGTTPPPRTKAPFGSNNPSDIQRSVDEEVSRLRSQALAARSASQTGTGDTGIIGWMLKKKIVSTKSQANLVLIIVIVVCLAGAAWFTLG